MKVGDLVKFHTNSWVFNNARARYENPGVVIEVLQGTLHAHPRYRVLWANEKMTVEHASYLQGVK